MPKRMISELIWTSKKLRAVQPPEFRVEYNWIIPYFEDNGVCEFDPDVLWSRAYALARPGWTPENVEELLDEFCHAGLLLKYKAEDKTWCWLIGSDKSGFLPPPSQRYSKFPLPSPKDLVGVPYLDPRVALGTPYPTVGDAVVGLGSGLGSGLGLGLGSGLGSGTAQCGAVKDSTLTPFENDKIKINNNCSGESPETPNHSRSMQALLSAIGKGFPVDSDDPIVGFLARLVDEDLEDRRLNITVAADGKAHFDDEDYEDYITVHPGDPRYPGFDPDADRNYDETGNGNARVTPRDSSALTTLCRFMYSRQVLDVLKQYPNIVTESQEEVLTLMTVGFGHPGSMENGSFCNLLSEKFAAAIHWAFKKSDFWPTRLKTLEDVIKRWRVIEPQYDVYYELYPEGKKPHDLGVGIPHREQEVNEEQFRADVKEEDEKETAFDEDDEAF